MPLPVAAAKGRRGQERRIAQEKAPLARLRTRKGGPAFRRAFRHTYIIAQVQFCT